MRYALESLDPGKLPDRLPWLRTLRLGEAPHLLERLDVVWKRGRASIRSPDRQYEAKSAYLKQLRQLTSATLTQSILTVRSASQAAAL